jgi:membrane protein YqaA with SNARE-associated domain
VVDLRKFNMLAYLGLFSSAFLAATLLPASSELVLLALLALGYMPGWLWLCATVGNTLGAVVNWVLGRFLVRYHTHPYFPFAPATLLQAQIWFQRFGLWSLLFSWLPVIGDGLTFIAGLMRVRFWLFVLLTALGKGARYAVIIVLGDFS